MKKRFCVLCLASILLITFISGCKPSAEEESSFKENYGDKESRKTLSICVDMGQFSNSFEDTGYATSVFNELIDEVKSATGIEKVSVLFLPGEGADRENLLSRLRVEIMAGSGPDVFLLRTVGNPGSDPNVIFNFPEKAMEIGLFLPLDEYIENNTQYTDWSKQTKVVMDAGRSEEGQVIIPLSYTLPVLVYPEDEIKFEPSSALTMQDILDNPNTAELGAVMYNGLGKKDEVVNSGWSVHENHLASMLGKLADFKSEELLFTEEDLAQALDTMFSLQHAADQVQLNYLEEDVGLQLCYQLNIAYFDEEMAMIPLYSRDGGVSASITSYAAVNRSTAFPEEAFTVIDLLMQEKAQQESAVYYTFFIPNDGLPLQDDLCQEEKPLFTSATPVRYLDKPYFDDLCTIKKQITNVRFRNEIDSVLENLVSDCTLEYLASGTYDQEAVSEAYEKMKRMMGE